MIDQDRINRFKTMTEADPTNELGFFSLGRAYIDGGQPKEAIPALQRVLALNPGFSKAYSLLGMAQKASGDQPGAVDTLTRGYKIANDRGDLMPRNDMAAMLKELGAPVPEIKAEALTPEDVGRRQNQMLPLRPRRPQNARTPLLRRTRRANPQRRLRPLLPRMDRPGHQGHQRTPAKPHGKIRPGCV